MFLQETSNLEVGVSIFPAQTKSGKYVRNVWELLQSMEAKTFLLLKLLFCSLLLFERITKTFEVFTIPKWSDNEII